MGSLRNAGGERGVFKTTDGGEIWRQVLAITEYTGCYEIHMDPRYPNILYATAHQRMRKLYTGVYGGPESGIYRSLDSGLTWVKMKSGLPSESTDRGVSWTKQSSYISSYPFYFQKLYCDTKDVNRVYSDDVFIQMYDSLARKLGRR